MLDKKQQYKCVSYCLRILLGEQGPRLLQQGYLAYGRLEDIYNSSAKLLMVSSGFFGDLYGSSNSLPQPPLDEIEGVPLLFGKPRMHRDNDRLIVYADLIASTYFMVTRYEEMVLPDIRDEQGRFPGKMSLPYRADFLHRPIVEEYSELLTDWLRETGIDNPNPNRQFSVLLTHDVDSPWQFHSFRHILRTTIRTLSVYELLANIFKWVSLSFGQRRDPFDTFEQIIQLDSNLQRQLQPLSVESIYFFIANGKGIFSDVYRINSSKVQKLISRLKASGAKIGLHSSYKAAVRPNLIVAEKNALEKAASLPINRNRHHLLAWLNIEDGWLMAKAGINWDTTLCYADAAGFRLGVCHPIVLFDPIRFEEMGIEEHPLIVMDCTLSNSNYMNLTEEQAFDYCEQLIEATYKYNGEFVMLWHNTLFAAAPTNYHPRLYQRLLNKLASLNYANVEV